MKNKIFTILGVALISFSSCKKSLDVDPRASLSPETIGAGDVQKLMNGVYDAVQEGATTYNYLGFVAGDLSGDNLIYRASFFQHGEIDNNAILTNNVLVARWFNAPYATIQRANDLIEILNTNASIPEATKKSLLTQCYYVRAFQYYRLVTTFGPVPIVFNRDVVNVPRKSVADVYTQIIDDLNLSIQNGLSFTNARFGSLEAAKALLARVYLIQKNYPEAKRLAEEVISSGKFSLATDFNSIFAGPAFTSTEHIFNIWFTDAEGTNGLSFFLQHPNMPGSGRAELPVDLSLVAAFEVGDTRKAASVTEIVAPAAFPNWYAFKYRDPSGTGGHPLYVSRISEMYLTSAEAQFMISNNATDAVALGRLNEVRTKRGLGALSTISLPIIIQERRVEFAFENLRWVDMRRTPSTTNPAKSMATVFMEGKGRSVNDELYPIPSTAIETNSLLLPNNPGY
ncbi:MAG: RagB/SusD family nutrient uptake outer membrane protein [Pedobacter sp.]|nr:MAG: RagB/SusD family nutrient uptake outer membrane protein [Pedobacter sp.]